MIISETDATVEFDRFLFRLLFALRTKRIHSISFHYIPENAGQTAAGMFKSGLNQSSPDGRPADEM